MMKLILSLTLTWALSSTAGALLCQNCSNPQCTSTVPVTCSSETACITASIQATSSGNTAPQIFKACAPPSLCPATGLQTVSANLGVASAVAFLQCCNTDNCNFGTLFFPAAQTNNSLQCLTCDSNSKCNIPLQCTGVEDRCFKANVTSGSSTSPFFGCASANLCKAAEGLGSIPFIQSVGKITGGPSCCGTSLCNSASDAFCIRLGMIHLLLGLLIFTLC